MRRSAWDSPRARPHGRAVAAGDLAGIMKRSIEVAVKPPVVVMSDDKPTLAAVLPHDTNGFTNGKSEDYRGHGRSGFRLPLGGWGRIALERRLRNDDLAASVAWGAPTNSPGGRSFFGH